jgi:integrase
LIAGGVFLRRGLDLIEMSEEAYALEEITADALVYQTRNGKPKDRRNALRGITTAAKKVGLQPEATEPLRNHDLRHSLAAILYGEGMTDSQVSLFLRHTNPNTAKVMYAGMNKKQKDEFAEQFRAIGI